MFISTPSFFSFFFFLSLHISLILSLRFSLLSSAQTAPVVLLDFSWKLLKLPDLFLSGVRSVMSSCIIWSFSISFYVSLYHVLAIFSFLMYLKILPVSHSLFIIAVRKSNSTFSNHHHHHHQCSAQGQVLHCRLRHQGCNSAKRRVFHCKLRNLGCSFTRDEMCSSFPLVSAPHSLFSIWKNLERSEKIPGAPTRRWGEWIWVTGPSRLHRNSPQGLNINSIRVFDQIRDPEIPITLRPINYITYCNYFECKISV